VNAVANAALDAESSVALRRWLAVGALIVATVLVSAIPILVDGWWFDVTSPGRTAELPSRVALSATCWTSVLAGVVARSRRPENPIGTWLIVSGLMGPTAFMVGAASPVWMLVSGFTFVGSASLGVAVLVAFPAGRLEGRAPLAIALVAFATILFRVEQLVLADPIALIPGWREPNPFYLHLDKAAVDAVTIAYDLFGIVFLVGFGYWIARRWLRLSGPGRRSIVPVLAGGLVFVVASVVQAAVEIARPEWQYLEAVRFVHTLTFSAIPLGFMAGVLRVRMARSALADLVVELGETPEPAELRRALAGALDDPSLEVALWSKERGSFLDEAGAPIPDVDQAAGSRAVTLLERGGEPLAAILHDPALLEDPGLVASVATAVRLTVENDRLQDQVRAQLEEVRASRRRIVEATDAERRRLERDIHDGAQQRLVALSMALGRARCQVGPDADPALAATLAQAADEVRAALAELRELARGIHPAILTDAGLETAVRSLTERSAVPVKIESAAPGRYPAQVEATAYFVVSEALANAAKHSAAAAVRVSLEASGKELLVSVRDDGRGGADPGRGSGLRGLRDRVEAAGGRLEIRSAAGKGTTVEAALPLDEEAG
jgi:signal transduction histidine kinase